MLRTHFAIAYVGQLLKINPEKFTRYDWEGRTIKVHRALIREFLGWSETTVEDANVLGLWLETQVKAYDLKLESLKIAAIERLRALKKELPTPERLERIVRSAIRRFEESFDEQIADFLCPSVREKLDELLETTAKEDDGEEPTSKSHTASPLANLKSDPGRLGINSLISEAEKLKQLRQLELPDHLFSGISTKVLQIYKQRVTVEPPRELRRHSPNRRYTLLATFCWLRMQEIIDHLVDLLVQIIHRIGARAERRVTKGLLDDFKKVSGKTGILFQLAEAAMSEPEGIVKEVIYPVVGEQTLKNLVREFKSTGTAYREKVHIIMCSSYSNHYRRMLPFLLSLLEFRSNNEIHKPVIQALELLNKYIDSRERYYDKNENVPLQGIISSSLSELILETSSSGSIKINRINYELAVLQALRDGLRCKEIWVVGANRYRNPEEDLPTDFEQQRAIYYQALQQPEDVANFIDNLQQQMNEGLTKLDRGMAKNNSVKILAKNNGWIHLSPFAALPEPANLHYLKTEIEQRWPMTSLLDILK